MNYLSIITNHIIIYHYQRLWKPLLTTMKNHCHHPVNQWPGLGPVVFHVAKTNSPEPPGIGNFFITVVWLGDGCWWLFYTTCFYHVLPGWWFEPLWKIWKSIGMIRNPIYGKIKNVPNHQPVYHVFTHIPLLLQPLDPKCIPDQLRPGSIFLSQLTFGVSFGFCRLLATTSWEPFAISEMTSHGIETMGEAVQ